MIFSGNRRKKKDDNVKMPGVEETYRKTGNLVYKTFFSFSFFFRTISIGI